MRLCRELNITNIEAVGHLHYLWWWCLDNVPNDGNLAGLTNDVLAEVAQWTNTGKGRKRDPNLFIKALITAKFIDETPELIPNSSELHVNCGLYLHNWDEYSGKLTSQRTLTKEQKRLGGQHRMANLSESERKLLSEKANNARWASQQSSQQSSQHTSDNLPATVQNSTEQYRTEQKSKEEIAAAVSADDEKFKDLVKTFEDLSGSVMTSTIAEQLIDAEKEYGSEIVVAAFKKAAAGGKRGSSLFAYCRPIFEEYKTNGIPNARSPNGQRQLIPDNPAPEKYLEELRNAAKS